VWVQTARYGTPFYPSANGCALKHLFPEAKSSLSGSENGFIELSYPLQSNNIPKHEKEPEA